MQKPIVICKSLGFTLLLLLISVPATAADDERRAPPAARTAGQLRPQIVNAITKIQELLYPAEGEANYAEAKSELDRLRERRFERMNDFEKFNTLNFYSAYYIGIDNIPEAIAIYEEIVGLEELRQEALERTLRTLGQLHGLEENWQESIDSYRQWQDVSLEEDDIVYRGLAIAYYQLQQPAAAVPLWISYMEFIADEGGLLSRDNYSFLLGLYFTLDDFESTLPLTRTMIMLFDNPSDWRNLSAIYSELDDQDKSLQAQNIAYLKQYLESENELLNFGRSLAGSGLPFNGSQVIKVGLERNIVTATEENFSALAQMYLIASDYAQAIAPASQAVELASSGDAADSLGYIQYLTHDYQASADAFEQAREIGELSNETDLLMFLARDYIELDSFDKAISILRQLADNGNENTRSNAERTLTYALQSQRVHDSLIEGKANALEFYQGYEPLQ